MTSLLSNICSVISNDAILLECLNLLITLSDDKVPNVRLNVCKALRPYVKVVGQNVIEKKISPILIKFKTDVDPDVVYFASIVFDDKI
jgi:hypothetical protein